MTTTKSNIPDQDFKSFHSSAEAVASKEEEERADCNSAATTSKGEGYDLCQKKNVNLKDKNILESKTKKIVKKASPPPPPQMAVVLLLRRIMTNEKQQ